MLQAETEGRRKLKKKKKKERAALQNIIYRRTKSILICHFTPNQMTGHITLPGCVACSNVLLRVIFWRGFCRKRQLQENERDARASERLRAPDWQCPNLVTQSPAVEIHFQPGAPILAFYTYRLALHPPLRANIRRFALNSVQGLHCAAQTNSPYRSLNEVNARDRAV